MKASSSRFLLQPEQTPDLQSQSLPGVNRPHSGRRNMDSDHLISCELRLHKTLDTTGKHRVRTRS